MEGGILTASGLGLRTSDFSLISSMEDNILS